MSVAASLHVAKRSKALAARQPYRLALNLSLAVSRNQIEWKGWPRRYRFPLFTWEARVGLKNHLMEGNQAAYNTRPWTAETAPALEWSHWSPSLTKMHDFFWLPPPLPLRHQTHPIITF